MNEVKKTYLIEKFIPIIIEFLTTILNEEFNPTIDTIYSTFQAFAEICMSYGNIAKQKIRGEILIYLFNALKEYPDYAEILNSSVNQIRFIYPNFPY